MRTVHLAAALLCLSGCTSTLTTTVIKSNDDPGATSAKQGLVYHLPASSQTVTLTHKLVFCRVVNDTLEFDFNTTATVKQTGHPDLTKVFVINPSELHAFSKAWGMNVVMHPNGLLKSFSTHADDKSIELGMVAIKTVANIAAISQGIPISIGSASLPPSDKNNQGQGVTPPRAACIPKLLHQPLVSVVIDNLKATVTNKQGELKKKQKLLAAKKGNTSAEEAAVLSAQKAVSMATLELDTFQKEISVQREYTIDTASIPQNQPYLLPLVSDDFLPWVISQDTELRNDVAITMANRYLFGLSLEKLTDVGLAKESTLKAEEDYPGLYYTTFGTRKLLLVRQDTAKKQNNLTMVFSGFINAPEFGHVGILPYQNHIGESNSFTAVFDANGALTSVDYGTERPASEKVESAIYEATDFYSDYANNRQTIRDADKLESQTLTIHALSIANSTYPNLTVDQLTARASIVQSLLIKLGDTEQSRAAITSLSMNIDNDNLIRLAEAL